jgi:UDPglucose 6-dehydrogenase/GDP-mannose 6-dehydrogenase
VSIIAVGTPFDGEKVDLKYIKRVAADIGKGIKSKGSYHVVVVKSTVPPGTTDEIVKVTVEEKSGKKAGEDFGIGVNPEFLREGCAVEDFMNPDRIVIGGIDKKTTDMIAEIYNPFRDVDIVKTNNRTAEMIKYTSNSILATLISFSNEIGNLCSKTKNVDVKDVMRGIHLDKRFNPILSDNERANPGMLSYLEAGCGFGGSCFPKDVKTLISYAEGLGEKVELLNAVIKINENQPFKLIELLKKHYGDIKDIRVMVLGLAFKPDTDDVRESPAIPLINSLIRNGARVKVYDPVVKTKAEDLFGDSGVEILFSREDMLNNLSKIDALFLVTSWKEFYGLESIINKTNPDLLVIDGRRIFDNNLIDKYEGIGLGD